MAKKDCRFCLEVIWTFFICPLLFFMGLLFISMDGGPKMHHYLTEEKYHNDGKCDYEKTEYLGDETCSYSESCGEDCSTIIHTTYRCYLISVMFTINHNKSQAQLYRSYQDALKSNHRCSIYECERAYNIKKYVSKVEGSETFQCFFHPEKPLYVYEGTANFAIVVGGLVGYVIMIVVGMFGCCICCAKSCLIQCKECKSFLIKKEIFGKDKHKRMVHSLKTKSVTNLRKVITRRTINKEIKIDDLKNKYKKLTPLAIATWYGRCDVMDYLYSFGADIRYIHPATKKGLLHFACISRYSSSIDWCLNKGLDVNLEDISGQTPLLCYMVSADIEEYNFKCIEKLLNEGSDTAVADSAGYTALHHACKTVWANNKVHARSIVSMLINAGCVAHNRTTEIRKYPIYTYGDTPFCVLLAKREYDLCGRLIEAGYQLSKDDCVHNVIHDFTDGIKERITYELHNPAPLLRQCRTAIRITTNGVKLQQKMNLLPLPNRLIKYLNLQVY